MKRFRASNRKPATMPHTLRRVLESLEDRTVPATISIADAVAIEGSTAYRYTDSIIAPDGYGLAAARELNIGQDGSVYISSHDTDVVKVFEGGTGRFLRDLGTSGGELDGPWGLSFGPDGRLYVGGRYSQNIIRFDVSTGLYEVFVATSSGGLGPVNSIAFGSDGNLYASDSTTVKKYSMANGAYLGDFIIAGSGGLTNVAGIAFGPDGNLYVASKGTGNIKRYNGQSGAFIDNFIPSGSGGLTQPTDIHFHSDGYVYVSTGSSAGVYRFYSTSGAFVDVLTSPVGTQGDGLAFGSSGELYLSSGKPTTISGSSIARFAPTSFAAFTLSLDNSATTAISVQFTTAPGTALALKQATYPALKVSRRGRRISVVLR